MGGVQKELKVNQHWRQDLSIDIVLKGVSTPPFLAAMTLLPVPPPFLIFIGFYPFFQFPPFLAKILQPPPFLRDVFSFLSIKWTQLWFLATF